jgi:hypothetical protein
MVPPGLTFPAVDDPRHASGAAFWPSWLGAFAAGAFLRLYRLTPQVLLGDEIHLVRAVAARPLPEILYTFGVTDVCQPVAGFVRWLSDRGVLVSEAHFRTPFVVAGLLMIALFPWLLRRASISAGASTSVGAAALLFPWFLALSPQLALYGRIARSYTPSALLAGLAAAAFFAWWRGRRPGSAVAYAVLGALAVWFHLLTAVFVAAPLAFAGLHRVVSRLGARRREGIGQARPGWLALAVVGGALAAGLLCLLVPAWDSLSQVLAEKGGKSGLRVESVLGAVAILAGTGRPVLVALFWIAAAAGFVVLFRRDREAALYGAFLAAAHLAALLVTLPFGIANPLILARYLIPVLPLVLLWMAHAFAWGPRPRVASAGLAAGGALLALLLAAGPFTEARFRTSSFVHHEDFLSFHLPLPTLPESRVPRFYRELAREDAGADDGEGAVLELPAYPEGQNRAYHRYQDLHRREVVLATSDPGLNDPRFAFHNRARPLPADLLESRARWLVVHLDLESEELAVELPEGMPRLWRARQRNLSEHFRKLAAGFPARVAPVLGPPDRRSARLLVWDLDRVRRQRSLTGRRGPAG